MQKATKIVIAAVAALVVTGVAYEASAKPKPKPLPVGPSNPVIAKPAQITDVPADDTQPEDDTPPSDDAQHVQTIQWPDGTDVTFDDRSPAPFDSKTAPGAPVENPFAEGVQGLRRPRGVGGIENPFKA